MTLGQHLLDKYSYRFFKPHPKAYSHALYLKYKLDFEHIKDLKKGILKNLFVIFFLRNHFL